MADLVFAPRVWETTTDTASPYDLLGASTAQSALQTFVDAGVDGKEVFIFERHQSVDEWQLSRATITDAAIDTFVINQVISSSNSGSQVSWTAGIRDVVLYDSHGYSSGPIHTITTATILDETHKHILANFASAFAITLPSVADYQGKEYLVKSTNTGVVTVTEDASDSSTIEDATGAFAETLTLSSTGEWASLFSDGTKWRLVGSSKFAATLAIGDDIDGGTSGSVLYVGSSGLLSQNNSKLFWDNSNAFLGIGTTIPGNALHIVTDGVASATTVSNVNTGGTDGSFFACYSDDGAATPNGLRLGGLLMGGAYDDTNTLYSSAFIGGIADEAWSGSARGTYLVFETTSLGEASRTEKMRMDANGNLGIGTLIPDEPLHVNGVTGDTALFHVEMTTNNTAVVEDTTNLHLRSSGDMADGFGPSLKFMGEDNASVQRPFGRIAGIRDGSDTEGALIFVCGTAGAEEFMRLDNDGNFGITTAGTVGYPFLVERNQASLTEARVTNTTSVDGAAAQVTVASNSCSGAYGAASSGSTDTGVPLADAVFIGAETDASGGLSVYSSHASGVIRFYTGGAASTDEQMRIDNDGNVGIGTTTSPTGTHGKVLSFGDNAGDPTMGSNVAGIYAKDMSGTVEMFAIDEADNATQLSPHDPETGEWVFNSINKTTGRKLKIRMEAFMKKLAEKFPEDFADLIDEEMCT